MAASSVKAITVDAGDGVNTIDLSAVTAADFTSLVSGRIILSGGSGVDTITGSALGDVIGGLGGNDIIHGGDGDDVISGGDGDDTIEAYDSGDVVDGNIAASAVTSILIQGYGGDDTIDLSAVTGMYALAA